MKILITVAALLLAATSSFAQVVPDNLVVHLKWPANAAAEAVERYRVEWSEDGQQWVNIGDAVTPGDSTEVRFSTKVAWLKNTIAVGMTVCFRITAIRGAEESDPSPNGCGEIQPAAEPQAPDISRPPAPVVEFEYE